MTDKHRMLQLTEFSMLCDFDDFCREHHIQYYLSSGTLLGAVRHKGFIPWDDDVDIEMPYKEYLKFKKIADQLPDKYFFQDYQTDPNWYRAHAKIRLQNTAMIENGYTGYNINHGIWIDIFILIGIRNKFDFNIKRAMITLSNYLQIENFVYNSIYQEYVDKLGKYGMMVLNAISRIPIKFRIKIHKWLLSIICTDFQKTKYTSCLWSNITKVYPSEIFKGECQWVEFEGRRFPASADWDKELTINYGDYMTLPPEEKREIHPTPILDFENSYTMYLTPSKRRLH